MPIIQISTYPVSTREQKESVSKAITNTALEILKVNRQQVKIISYDQRRPNETCLVSGEQSSEERNFEIPMKSVHEE